MENPDNGGPAVHSHVLQVAPFPLMILTLFIVNIGYTEWMTRLPAMLPTGTRKIFFMVIKFIHIPPPASLGVPFERE